MAQVPTPTFDIATATPGVPLNHNFLMETDKFEVGKDRLGYWVKFFNARHSETYTPMERFSNEDAAIGYGLLGVAHGVFVG